MPQRLPLSPRKTGRIHSAARPPLLRRQADGLHNPFLRNRNKGSIERKEKKLKQFKTLVALVLALVMVLSVASVAFAADPTYTITVNASDNHTYRVYQVLTGTLADASSKKLGNPVWGADAADSTASVDDFITSITASGLTRAQISALVEAATNTTGNGQGTVDKDNPMTVAPGYYVLVDVTTNLADGESLSLNIVEVVRNVTVSAKNGTTTSDKTTGDVNDSTGASQENQESADYDIGDHIPYTLSATLPANYADYVKYYLQFQDDMSKGLTLDTSSVKIYYGDSDTEGTPISFTAANGTSYTDGGQLYTYTIADVKTAAPTLVAGDKIYIKYTATLNSNAVITDAGNPNKSRVEFSKNPNWDGNGTPDTGDTPWDIVVVFTYKTVFNKVDGEGKPLTGADFRLDKFVKDASGSETYKSITGSWVDVTTLGDTVHPSKSKDTLTKGADSANEAKFTFAGLDDGYYRLVETVTPQGYNTLDITYFEITANHTVTGLTSLTGTDGVSFTMTPVLATAELDAEIENNQGTELPSTGGIGTTIFYVAGIVLVLGAAAIIIARRKAEQE